MKLTYFPEVKHKHFLITSDAISAYLNNIIQIIATYILFYSILYYPDGDIIPLFNKSKQIKNVLYSIIIQENAGRNLISRNKSGIKNILYIFFLSLMINFEESSNHPSESSYIQWELMNGTLLE